MTLQAVRASSTSDADGMASPRIVLISGATPMSTTLPAAPRSRSPRPSPQAPVRWQIGAAGNPGAFPSLSTGAGQLQSKFKHAADFGVSDNWISISAGLLDEALRTHMANPAVRAIPGSYRGNSAIRAVDPSTGLHVIRSPSGEVSGWELSPDQLRNVLERGSLRSRSIYT